MPRELGLEEFKLMIANLLGATFSSTNSKLSPEEQRQEAYLVVEQSVDENGFVNNKQILRAAVMKCAEMFHDEEARL